MDWLMEGLDVSILRKEEAQNVSHNERESPTNHKEDQT